MRENAIGACQSFSAELVTNAAPSRPWPHDVAAQKEDICPACRRLEDRLPAGILTLHGDFARQHANEILSLTRHEETAEKAEHPLNRIATIEHTDAGWSLRLPISTCRAASVRPSSAPTAGRSTCISTIRLISSGPTGGRRIVEMH